MTTGPGRHLHPERAAPVPAAHRACSRLLSVYGYQAYQPLSRRQKPLHPPRRCRSFPPPKIFCVSCVPINSYTALEARVLDIALMLHAEHGGGNNSTFTTHVRVFLRHGYLFRHCGGTRLFKRPKARRREHQGRTACLSDMKQQVRDWTDENEICDYLHTPACTEKRSITPGSSTAWAMPCIPSPTQSTQSWKRFAEGLSKEKGREDEYATIHAQSHGSRRRSSPKSAASIKVFPQNVDFYSGFIYSMLRLADGALYPHLRHAPESRAGAPTASKSLSMPVKSSARRIKPSTPSALFPGMENET